MRVSVVISSYKRAAQLEKCLWSILHGSRLPEEIIVVDDGPSGDSTPEVVRQAADQFHDLQISYIPYKREGGWANPAKPRNVGIRMTDPANELIIFSEPEMLWAGGTLETFKNWFENPPKERKAREDWLPPIPVPHKFFLTASHIGYVHGPNAMDNWQDFSSVFRHDQTERKFPEINTRLACCRREDGFAVTGWDEGMVGWGYDDVDFIERMHRIGAHHIPLDMWTVHMPHDPPPAGEGEATPNLQRMQKHQRENVLSPNGPRWGLGPENKPFDTEITEAMWDQIQAEELLSWTQKAWPSLAGKLYRERKYLKQAAADLGLLNLPFSVMNLQEHHQPEIWLDVGCGPYSIMELLPNPSACTCLDPLHDGYEAAGLRKMLAAQCQYVPGRGEILPYDDNSVTVITSINGIDHYQSPRNTLIEMNRILEPGGFIGLHYCINNASEGHPHPAHRIDLDIPEMLDWGRALGLTPRIAKQVFYGWRHQKAAAILFEKEPK